MKNKLFHYLLVLPLCLWAKEKEKSPLWFETGRDNEYPEQIYLVGLGVSEESSAKAAQNAMVQVAQQISAQVDSKWISQKEVSTSGSDEEIQENTKSQSTVRTEGLLEGVQVVRKMVKDSVFYALAILHKANYVTAQNTKLNEQIKLINTEISNSQKALKRYDFDLYWSSMEKAYRMNCEIGPLLSKVRALDPKIQVSDTLLSLGELDELLANDLEKFQIVVDTLKKAHLIKVFYSKQKIPNFELDLYNQDQWLMSLRTNHNGQVMVPRDSLLPGLHLLSLIPKLKIPKQSKIANKKYRVEWSMKIKSPFENCVIQPSSNPYLDRLLQIWQIQLEAKAKNLFSIETGVVLKTPVVSESLPSRYEVTFKFIGQAQTLETKKKVLARNEESAVEKAFQDLDAWELKPWLDKMCY